MRILSIAAAILAVAAVVPTASAQKSKDTLRLGFLQPVRVIDTFYEPGPEQEQASRMVFDNLVNYDNIKKEYVGGIAESWKQTNPTTMEFQIRKDVKFTDGQPMTMDDVIYTFKFMMDPTAKYRFQDTRISWIAAVEKAGPWTLRLVSKEPMAIMLAKLTQFPSVIPEHIHAKLENKQTFGNNPVGTGPYRAVEVESGNHFLLERNPGYTFGNAGKPAGAIKNVLIKPVPDAQTQTALMLRGEQDMMYAVDADLAASFENNPDFKVSAQDSVSFNFLMFDTKGRSGNNVFTDKRVRQAMMYAIDRENLRQLIHPDVAKLAPLAAVCSPLIKFCDSSDNLPKFDPNKAKQLLAEAGYPKGFEITISTWGEGKEAAEGVAGMWRKVGVIANVNVLTFGTFVKGRIDGLTAIVTLWDNSVGQPDIDNTAEYYFLPNARNYNKDPILEKLAREGRQELDEKKRAAIYKSMFDRSNEEAYLLPLNRIPAVIVARKEVKLLGGHKHPQGFEIDRIAWN